MSAVQARVRRLESRGVITGYAAAVDHEALGLPLAAFVAITPLDPAQPDDAPQRLSGLDAIEACYSVAGAEHYLLLVRAASPRALEGVLQEIRARANVATRTTIVLQTLLRAAAPGGPITRLALTVFFRRVLDSAGILSLRSIMTVTVERAAAVTPADVHALLARHLLVDGFDLVLDLEQSRGSYLVDARNGRRYLDLFTFFASSALGMNHPALADDPEFRAELAAAALNKPSNSDVYTVAMARFVDTFARVLGDPALPHLFFVDGGALAVENALKVAFDWKTRLNEARGLDPALGTRVLHLREAFHGRSGYTLSLTNTDPNKVARFPKFDWPRIDAPYSAARRRHGARRERTSLAQARAAFEAAPARHRLLHRRADPGRGRRPPLPARSSCRRCSGCATSSTRCSIFDEVQTGCGLTGTAWAYQQLG